MVSGDLTDLNLGENVRARDVRVSSIGYAPRSLRSRSGVLMFEFRYGLDGGCPVTLARGCWRSARVG